MSVTDKKNKPAERFSVLIVPRNSSRVRKHEFSGRLMHVAIGVAIAAFVLFAAGVSSLVYYRYAYLSTEEVRVKAAEYMRERAAILGRLAFLEEAMARTERFAAKIESAVGKNREGLTGRGPVDEDDSLPSRQDLMTSESSASLGSGVWKSPFSKSLTSNLNLSIDKLEDRADSVEERVHSVFALQQDKNFFWASLPSIWPSRGWVTSEFGDRRGFRSHGRLHEGIDIAGPRGTPIMAPGDGVVTYRGYYHGYGQMITVDHGFGVSTLYGHCSAMFVAEGQQVKRGMIIAAIGNTGSSTGPHLHYEVHVDGIPVNPVMYIMQ